METRGTKASSRQAENFCVELHAHIAQLEDQAAKFKSQMARYTAIGQSNQVKRLQNQLRMLILERRHVANMLASLGHGYPCGHAHTRTGYTQAQLPAHSSTG